MASIPNAVAAYDRRKMQALLRDPGIVRNRLKIASSGEERPGVPQSTERVRQLRRLHLAVCRRKTDWSIRGDVRRQVPASTAQSDAMSKDLKKRGFTFVGTTICYAFMQAVGMVNDHLIRCFRRKFK